MKGLIYANRILNKGTQDLGKLDLGNMGHWELRPGLSYGLSYAPVSELGRQ